MSTSLAIDRLSFFSSSRELGLQLYILVPPLIEYLRFPVCLARACSVLAWTPSTLNATSTLSASALVAFLQHYCSAVTRRFVHPQSVTPVLIEEL